MKRRQKANSLKNKQKHVPNFYRYLLIESKHILTQTNLNNSIKSKKNPCLKPTPINMMKSMRKQSISSNLINSPQTFAFDAWKIKQNFFSISKKQICYKSAKQSAQKSLININLFEDFSQKYMFNRLKVKNQYQTSSTKVTRKSGTQARLYKIKTQNNQNVLEQHRNFNQQMDRQLGKRAIFQQNQRRPWTAFRNSQLKKAIETNQNQRMRQRQKERGICQIFKKNGKQFINGEFNSWEVQSIQASQF